MRELNGVPLGFRWKTRIGSIVFVNEENVHMWDQRGNHLYDSNLDLVECERRYMLWD